ncbi:MAG: hypothetical protein OK422_06590 [Thaumarchaeota archaeon]|nr:hypothetical protein [Nitrososphaerota archaeon]
MQKHLLGIKMPAAGTKALAPLFAGSLRFVHATFLNSGKSYVVPTPDIKTAAQYASLAVVPISEYASQYGPNAATISGDVLPFKASLGGGKYNDRILAAWTDEIAKQQGLSADSCLVLLNPRGVVNTDADATQGVLGYHSISPGGLPYIFVNVTGEGFSIQDDRDLYALALSHEIAEMIVDPAANGSNPEVCDPCGPNCPPSLRDYFGPSGSYLETTATFPPGSGYGYYVNAIVQPNYASQCPAPLSACAYSPPKPANPIGGAAKGLAYSPFPASAGASTLLSLAKGVIEHVVIIVKENHTFDNYFGMFPGANGITLPRSPNPPLKDPNHTHAAWLTRDASAVREQFVEQDIPAYFSYARGFTLCDNYYTEVAGPSTPNHLMLVAADSPVIDNPSHFQTPAFKLQSSLPKSLELANLTWRSYGGFATDYLQGINTKSKATSDRFKTDAASGALPNVAWLFAPAEYDEHPPNNFNKQGGNVTVGMQWTVDQVNALVQGGLWPKSVIFITWDDWGGWYDHVNPPDVETWNGNTHPAYNGTQFRYGPRVGCLVLSPYAKSALISSALHSHVSLVKFCESVFGLQPLNQRDTSADDMSDCFDFAQNPLTPPPAVPR